MKRSGEFSDRRARRKAEGKQSKRTFGP